MFCLFYDSKIKAVCLKNGGRKKMKSIILYNQGGYPPELLAFNGETNFAILYYACTIKPYVLACKLGDDVRSNEF